MGSYTGHVMNLSNSIIGVSLLAMPFCFKQCGITLAILMLILSSVISRMACHFLVKSSTMCRRRNFEFLAFYTFGPSGKLLVELGVIGFMMGTCVAFFVVMGDLGPAIISKIFNISNNSTLRTSVLIGLGLFVVLPLGLLRNVESLAAISTVTIGYYFLFILKIFFESSSHLVSGDWWSHVRFWQPDGILQCIPIFAMALSCQTQLFEIYNSLPSPSIEKMNSVVGSALNLCTIVYTSVGLLGYIAYCKGNFTGNIMLSFTPSLSSEMFKLGFVMSIAVSFPLVIFPCRASLFSLIFKRMPIHQELSQTSSHIPDSRFKCLTVAIVSVALVTGLLIPSIELVLGFVGSTIGIAICVIFPALSFLNLYNKNTNERVVAKMTLMFGLVIMIMGTFGNLFAAVEHKPVMSTPGDSKNFPQVKVPLRTESSTETPKKQQNKGVVLVNPIPPEKLIPYKPPDGLKPRSKTAENARKEPPIPMAPVANDLEKKKEETRKVDAIETKIKEVKEKQKEEKKKEEKVKESFEEAKHAENINKDAIEKENREIMEVEKQKKTEEDKKQEELLKKLKEHQDEQKKLLEEQEKILREMKNREKEKKLEQSPPKEVANLLPVKTIKPDEFQSNINKIQNVLDDLKDTKNILEKEKVISEEKRPPLPPVNASRKAQPVETHKNDLPKPPKEVRGPETEVRNPIVSVPLPLAKLRGQGGEGKEVPRSKQEVLGRDILVEGGREKREAEGEGECSEGERKREEGREEGEGVGGTPNAEPKVNEKTEKVILGKKEESVVLEKRKNGSSSLIKNSVHLSVDLSGEKKPEMTDVEISKLISNFENSPLIPKKRDLKYIPDTDS